eukprot:TRINITY_DN91448_c0_g1_i1.p1 TRINITY_DN91448_c0_g1~~TRINITY_DN91448_c0_g1_i1.p1  ORF type:complete len:536 (-),score=108.41 TRINITY_DN91448_c0_g1_i1:88-1695(-)
MGTQCSKVRDCGGRDAANSRQIQVPAKEDEEALMKSSWHNWGSIEAVVNEPLGAFGWESSWLSVILMWLLLPINLLVGAIGGFVPFVYQGLSSVVMCSVQLGNPFYMMWIWWSYTFTLLTALVANSMSRLGLFLWERQAFGNGDYFWHGEGIWATTYPSCDEILKSEQLRGPAFGAVTAPVPDLFPTKILIFLPNVGSDSEWKYIRSALHDTFLTHGAKAYQDRLVALREHVAQDWKNVTLSEMTKDVSRLQRLVAKSVFFMMLGVWIAEEEADILTGWRTNASLFILPRLTQRFIFNYGINKVKKLRVDTVKIIEKYQLQDIFSRMNDLLPVKYRRDPVVRLCDEIMYVIGFAGIGGTSAMCETASAFMQVTTPKEFPASSVSFSRFDSAKKMIEAYKRKPFDYFKECCRIDPPVTSATSILKEDLAAVLGNSRHTFAAGTYRQYCLSLANRDPNVFKDPKVFDPTRAELDQALTWNGAFGTPGDDKTYPRLCPGRYLSLDVATTIFNVAVNREETVQLSPAQPAPAQPAPAKP